MPLPRGVERPTLEDIFLVFVSLWLELFGVLWGVGCVDRVARSEMVGLGLLGFERRWVSGG